MRQINILKTNQINLLAILFVGLMFACGEEERGQYATDNVPPGQVSGVVVENVPGGAVISYKVPDDGDLLYVKVLYTIPDGTQVEQKSSAYVPRITVEGLGLSKKQTVQLICGDRSGNESDPYPVDIEPLDAPIYGILASINMIEDFGGIILSWDNPLKANVVLTLYVKNEKGGYDEIRNVYSSSALGKYSIRGFTSVETTFAVTIRDRWKNKTDMISGTFVPLFEEKIDRKKFARWNPPGIPLKELNASWSIDKLWDGLLADPGYSFPNDNVLPTSFTFNLGQMAKVNRIKMYQRTSADQLFAGYNAKRFQLWASPHPNVDENFEGWLFLGDFTSEKPSGLPLGQLTEEDVAYGEAGEEYMIEINQDIPVQYIRVHVISTHGGGTTVAQFYEMEFFGLVVQGE